MAVIVGDDWTTVPAEADERPMPPLRERTYPPQRKPREGEDGKLPDPLTHWEEVWGEW